MATVPPGSREFLEREYAYCRGFQFEQGFSVERSLPDAFQHYSTAAKLDHDNALYTCGKLWFINFWII